MSNPNPPNSTDDTLQLPSDVEPLEEQRPSTSFGRNFSSDDSYARWNTRFDAFFLPPHSPFDPSLPSDAVYKGSSRGFRPIGDGGGGLTGEEFKQSLGGNVRTEQFTVSITVDCGYSDILLGIGKVSQ